MRVTHCSALSYETIKVICITHYDATKEFRSSLLKESF